MNPKKLKTQANVTKSLETHKSIQKNLTDALCKTLSDENDISAWIDQLWEFKEAYGKVLYSELSTFIIETAEDATIDNFEKSVDNISQNMDAARKTEKIDFEHYSFWLKYHDHCKLAILQRHHYNITKTTVKDITTELIKSETDRIQKDLTSQLIGLVSIFTALSFVIFGGINILSSILQNVQLANITRLICVGLLWTLSMSILFYIFVRFILKIMKPEQEQVFGKQFMRSFWLLIGILVALFIGVVAFDFYKNKKENKVIIQPQEIIIHDSTE